MLPKITLLLTVYCFAFVSPAKILALLPIVSPSHHIWNSALLVELAKRGHSITVLSTDPQKTPVPNLTDLIINGAYEEVDDEFDLESMADIPASEWIKEGLKYMSICCQIAIKSRGFQQLLQYPNDVKFDLIIAETLATECIMGLRTKFGNPPLILINAYSTSEWLTDIASSPHFPSYMTSMFYPASSKLSFFQRLTNLYTHVYSLIMYHYDYLPEMDNLAREHFGPGLPPVWDVMTNMSLALSNFHPAFDYPSPVTPNIIAVGGLQIRDPKPLPKDLQKFLDEAKDGAIFFSLGSNVKSNKIAPEKVQHILDTFREIPQRVLWKFESDSLANLPKNVMISKWLPQSDVLAHPNMKLFISHCGLLSSHETVHRGVPVVGIPFIADQHVNIARLVNHGVAVKLPFGDLTKETLLRAITTVLHTSSYSEKMKLLSERFRDNPQTPLETAVFWTEYVIRHKGAPQLRPASLDLNMVQYLLLDVIAFIIVALLLALHILLSLCRRICCRTSTKKKQS